MHDETKEFIKQFREDHFIALDGIDVRSRDTAERNMRVDYGCPYGGYIAGEISVETVTFYPDRFAFGYKGGVISGLLSGVAVEIMRLENGEEADCERDDVEAAVLEARGFPIDPREVEEPEMDF